MIKNASRLWGFHDTEAESSFDPLVGMLMGTLAFELEKISGEIHNSESRVVEKLVNLLTPEPIVGEVPSHGILRAQSHQPSFTIHPSFQFYMSRKVKSLADPSRSEEQHLFYTPAGNYKLFNGQVKYIATGRTIFEVDKEGYKEAIAENRLSSVHEHNCIWIGIEFSNMPESFDGLTLFFDLRSEMHEESFYQFLIRANWFINDIPVQFIKGYGQEEDFTRKDIDTLDLELNTSAKVCKHVNRFYRHKFMTLSGDHMASKFLIQGKYPSSLRAAFDDDSLKSIPGYFWIKLEFQQPLPEELIENIFCSLNCFPVINRKLNEFTYSARELISIIPLPGENAFFDMESVSNSKGVKYTMKSFSRVREIEKGAYILRQGGVGRFDSRDAVEILNYLIELLRDENAAFTVLGTDMISSNIREMNQIIARLDQKLKDTSVQKENTNYLMLRALPNDETVFVKFWSTNGLKSNNIKPGTPLNIYSGSDIRQETVRFLTQTAGGRDRLDNEDRLSAYRVALLSKDRVVTAEDIKALCYSHFGTIVEKVEVKKGITMGATTDGGFMRTIDIDLWISRKRNQISDEELKFLKEDLKVKLEEKSMNILPFRIFFK